MQIKLSIKSIDCEKYKARKEKKWFSLIKNFIAAASKLNEPDFLCSNFIKKGQQ